jgi:hypothetical protein
VGEGEFVGKYYVKMRKNKKSKEGKEERVELL